MYFFYLKHWTSSRNLFRLSYEVFIFTDTTSDGEWRWLIRRSYLRCMLGQVREVGRQWLGDGVSAGRFLFRVACIDLVVPSHHSVSRRRPPDRQGAQVDVRHTRHRRPRLCDDMCTAIHADEKTAFTPSSS